MNRAKTAISRPKHLWPRDGKKQPGAWARPRVLHPLRALDATAADRVRPVAEDRSEILLEESGSEVAQSLRLVTLEATVPSAVGQQGSETDSSVIDSEEGTSPPTQISRRPPGWHQGALLAGADAASLLGALLVARPIPPMLPRIVGHQLAFALGVGAWVLVFHALGLHSPGRLSKGEEFIRILAAAAAGLPLVLLLGGPAMGSLSGTEFESTWLSAVGFATGARIARAFLIRVRTSSKDRAMPTLIVGSKEQALSLAGRLQACGRFHPIGYVAPPEPELSSNGLPRIGNPECLRDAIRKHAVRCVFVEAGTAEDDVLPILRAAREGKVEVRTFTGLPAVLPSRLYIEQIDGLAALCFKPANLTGPQAAIKRAFDLVVASLALVVASPLLVVVAVAIRLTSPGPAIYRQLRVTRGGRAFTMYKFRTMVSGDEPVAEAPFDPSTLYFKIRDDPRVCKLGRLLRRLSVDELPQLINVIRGEMSLVGPRPLWVLQIRDHMELLQARHDVRAGITGWWQVNGRSDIPPAVALRMDSAYVESWSLGLDLHILLRTIGAVLSARGAY